MSAGGCPAVLNFTWGSPTDCLGNTPLLILTYKGKTKEEKSWIQLSSLHKINLSFLPC